MNRIMSLARLHPWSVPVVATILALALAWLSSGSASAPADAFSGAIDTYIPAGFVLVPINIQNSESVDAVFGNFGVVDLYPTAPGSKLSQQPLAQSVKMLRAPKNPSQFGVLVPERDASQLVRHVDPFYVVIHRPDRLGTRIEKARPQKSRPIIYEEEK